MVLRQHNLFVEASSQRVGKERRAVSIAQLLFGSFAFKESKKFYSNFYLNYNLIQIL